MTDSIFDYVVVGAGSAGCALAARLAERGKHSVCLLEGGGQDDHIWIHIPLGVGKLLTNEKYAWRFFTEPQEFMKGQQIYWPRGKVLGGSSSLNGMAYVWGDPNEYDSWTHRGVSGWDFKSLLPYFQRLESNPYSNQASRGKLGPVKITDRAKRESDQISNRFLESCRRNGIPESPDYNVCSYEGVRYLEQTAHNGVRWSAAKGYLALVKNKPNFRLVTNAFVTRCIFDGTKCVGLEYEISGVKKTLRVRKEVILSAGAIQSPQILELSGVGSGSHLQQLGIPVVVNLPAVGENMSDHLQVRCTYQTPVNDTINDLMRSPLIKVREALKYVFQRKGLLANTSSTVHAITRANVNSARPDCMIRVYHISGKDRYSRSPGAGIDPFSGFSIGGFMLYPKSRGSIHCSTPDPHAHPRINPQYLSNSDDQDSVVNLLRLIKKIGQSEEMKSVIAKETRPGPLSDSYEELLDYAKESGQTAWHTVGTCSMGASAATSVVDSKLRVHGVSGLRVADASVMPTIASSNTNAPSMMIGERAADLILEG